MFNLPSRKEVKALTTLATSLQQQVVSLTRAATLANVSSVLSTLNYFPDWRVVGNAERYSSSDDVYSIINLIVKTTCTIPFYVYEVKDEKALKSLKRSKAVAAQKVYQLKALEDLPETDKVAALIADPFLGFSSYEGWEALLVTLLTQGEVFLYKIRPDLGVNAGLTQKLGFMFPQNTVLKVSTVYPYEVYGYQYVVNGQVVADNIPVEDVIHIKYFNPDIKTDVDRFRGLSPLKVLARRLARMDKGLDISTSQLQNGGVPGIVYDKGPGFVAPSNDGSGEVSVTSSRRDNFLKYLVNEANKGAPYFAGSELGYIQLGLPLTDMDLATLDKIDFKKLCNAYGVSDRLLNNDATGSEVSDDNARKGLYTNAVLPLVTRIAEAFNRGILPDFTDKKRHIQADITEVPELQADMKESADIIAALPIFIPNNVLETFNFGRIDDELMDKVYVKNGYSLLEDLQPVDPVDEDDDTDL